MTNIHSSSSWHVGRVAGTCHACNVGLPPNTACWAALCDRPLEQLSPAEKKAEEPKGKKGEEKVEVSPFVRLDFCEKCWAEGKRPADGAGGGGLTMFSFWKTTVPAPEQKKKLLVDDSVLMDVFARMEEKTEPQEIRFRFVLALILMRKRLLKYESSEPVQTPAAAGSGSQATEGSSPPPEVWRMIPRGSDKPVQVINPHLTAEQITEVSQQLSAILAEEV
ncbi:MAG TPA: hypothetical protein VM008_11210 [Phycisphaerae bacterium]|nr:hypothetical protein [Phycisphaerae bacterium]